MLAEILKKSPKKEVANSLLGKMKKENGKAYSVYQKRILKKEFIQPKNPQDW